MKSEAKKVTKKKSQKKKADDFPRTNKPNTASTTQLLAQPNSSIQLFKPNSTMLRLSAARTVQLASRRAASTSTHAISRASIIELEKRWEDLPSVDQEEIVSKLAKRQELNWNELTVDEKKAAWFISYGSWGPRRPVHAKGDAGKIATGVFVGLGVSLAIFLAIRSAAPAPPKTLSREWQDQSDEYLKSKNANPFSGYSQVQSE